jgi:hypothetical protein
VIEPGEPWGDAPSGPPDAELTGTDLDLAGWVATHPGGRLAFTPSSAATSDLARAVGLSVAGPRESPVELVLDALTVRADGVDMLGVNAVVLGVPPDRLGARHRRVAVSVRIDGRTARDVRAASVCVVNGQFLRGNDLAPRGHPGDGYVEVQVYALPPRARRPMRARLATGTHLPHPGILTFRGRSVEIRAGRALPIEVDGRVRARARLLGVAVSPGAFSLLV